MTQKSFPSLSALVSLCVVLTMGGCGNEAETTAASGSATSTQNTVQPKSTPIAAPTGAQASLTVGSAAPAFELPGSDGQTHRLSDYAGQYVVLAFFPKAFTGGWTLQCKALRDSDQEIQSYNVAYFMASTDTLEDNTGFAEKNNASFPILADTNKTVSDAYGVLGASGYAGRVTFYIDPDGIIARIDRSVNPRTAGADLVAALQSLGVGERS